MGEIRAENIPEELKALLQWVAWKAVPKENGKIDKLPRNPKTGASAEVNDPSTWGSFGTALQAVSKYRLDGIGFVFSQADPYCGIDLDSCYDPETGAIEPWAESYLSLFKSYSEVTPSGKGFHIIIKGNLPADGNRKGKIEAYDQKRFFTFTGGIFNGNSAIESRQRELESFHQDLFPKSKGPEAVRPAPNLDLDDEELLKIARNAANGGKFSLLWNGQWKEAGYPSQSEADQALCNQLAFYAAKDAARMERLFRQSGLCRDKWEKRADYRKATIENAIRATTNVFEPNRNGGEAKSGKTTCTPKKNSSFTCEKAPESNEFPVDALSGVALRYAELFSTYTESPLQFYYFSFLTCLGSILADKATLESQIEPQPRLYTLLLGESADDRKSTAIDQTVKFFHKFSMDKILNVCHGLGSAEGLQARMEESKGPNGTTKLILFFDEFKSFVSKCKIEGSVLLPCVTTLFESNRYESRTKTTNVKLENAYLSLLAASTVQTFQNIWTSQFTDIGFGNRLWIVTGSGKRRFSIPRKIPESDLNRLKRELNEILSLFMDRVEMPIKPEAFDLFDKWYLGLESSLHSKRIDTYALRLMPLLAANDGKTSVDEDTVRKVMRLCDWQLQTRKLHDPIDCDNAIAKMEEKIRRNLKAKGPLKDWQLKQLTGASRDGLFVFENAKKNLMRAHEIEWDKSTKKYCEACHENS